MIEINKKNLQHLFGLARIKLDSEKEEKFLKELQEILNYFEQLQEVNTDNISPMTGGMELKNALREDEKYSEKAKETRNAVIAFPKEEKGYLKVPPVFE